MEFMNPTLKQAREGLAGIEAMLKKHCSNDRGKKMSRTTHLVVLRYDQETKPKNP